MGIKFTNNGEALLETNIDDSETLIELQTDGGSYFPTIVNSSGDFFYATLVDTSGNMEIIKVTEHQVGTDVFQVVERAADGLRNQAAVARAFVSSSKVQARLNVKIFEDDIHDDVILTYGGVVAFATSVEGVSIYDTDGNDPALRFRSDAEAEVGAIQVAGSVMYMSVGSDVVFSGTENGAAALFYNDVTKLETTNTGATITGALVVDGLTLGGFEPVTLGGGGLIYGHNVGVDTVEISDTTGVKIFAKFKEDGPVELYHNGTKKFETTNTGATLTGILVADGLVLGDDEFISFGAGPDGRIYSTGLQFVITNGGGTENFIKCSDGGQVILYYNGEVKGGSLDDGLIAYGCLTIPEMSTPDPDSNHGKIYTKDTNRLYFQDGNGFEHELAFA
jgi:hypothetical protein